MGVLRYPLELDRNKNDYIKFEHFKYQVNSGVAIDNRGGVLEPLTEFENGPSRGSGSFDDILNRAGYEPTDSGTNSIVLYMPNSTPATHYGHEATYQTFPGPLGSVGKQMLSALGSKDFSGGMQDVANVVKDNGLDEVGGSLYQVGVEQAASFFNADAATTIAMGQGKLFNPNAEMIYKQPYHRKFNFTFDFTPKSAAEASEVDEIIFEFKKWSAPSMAGAGKNYMYIPDLWRISYHEATGKVYRRMNLFKPSMITNLVVQDNPSSNFHITVQDELNGHVPVHTAINVFFQETMAPVREDHDRAKVRGHHRGF